MFGGRFIPLFARTLPSFVNKPVFVPKMEFSLLNK
jgi:hypothetical protein